MKYFKMNSKVNSDSGFTIVELLVIVLIIGVLSTVLVLTYSGVQLRQRNTTRINDIKLIQSNLETYYAQSGFYPTLGQLNSPSWTTKNLKALDPNNMRDPGSKSTAPRFSETPGPNQYSYQPTALNTKSVCDDRTIACAQYVLEATLGGNSGTFVEKSLN